MPGEKVDFSEPPDAGQNYEAFMRQQLLAAFASVGVPYEIATGDLRNISDRVLRVVVNEFHRSIEQFQWNTFIHQWCRPIWAAWVDAVALSGAVPMPDYFKNRRLYQRVLWVPQGWPYFNPVQDIKAKKDQIRGGLTSLQRVILAQGDDPDEIQQENIDQNQAADDNGLIYDTDARKTTANGANSKQELDDQE